MPLADVWGWEGHEGKILGNIPFLDLSSGSITTCEKQFTGLYVYDLGTLPIYVIF